MSWSNVEGGFDSGAAYAAESVSGDQPPAEAAGNITLDASMAQQAVEESVSAQRITRAELEQAELVRFVSKATIERRDAKRRSHLRELETDELKGVMHFATFPRKRGRLIRRPELA